MDGTKAKSSHQLSQWHIIICHALSWASVTIRRQINFAKCWRARAIWTHCGWGCSASYRFIRHSWQKPPLCKGVERWLFASISQSLLRISDCLIWRGSATPCRAWDTGLCILSMSSHLTTRAKTSRIVPVAVHIACDGNIFIEYRACYGGRKRVTWIQVKHCAKTPNVSIISHSFWVRTASGWHNCRSPSPGGYGDPHRQGRKGG